jgi:hypothetical protein
MGGISVGLYHELSGHLTMTHVVQRTTPVRAEDKEKSEVIHIVVAQLAQHIGEHLAQKSHRRFLRWPHPARLQGRVGTMQAQDHRPSHEPCKQMG